MPASAYLFPIPTRLEWENSAIPGDTLAMVDPTAPIDVAQYRTRDQELAYRDMVVAAAMARVVLKVSDIWGFSPQRPVIAASPEATLDAVPDDIASVALQAPGTVVYVDNQSVAFDALTTDEDLYVRDILLYEELYLAAAASLELENPLAPLEDLTVRVGDSWSQATGLDEVFGIGYSLDFNTALFKQPDQHLAYRDNVLAGYLARLQVSLNQVWSQANRILLRIVDDVGVIHEPETYTLLSDDGRYRTWQATPQLPNQLILKYDKLANTISWVGERLGQSGSPQVAANSVVVGGALITRQPALQPASDSEFYRQKSARLPVKSFVDNTVYATSTPQNFAISVGLYQPDSTLLTVPSSAASFDVPIIVPAGCIRVGLLIKPSRDFSVLGFQNVEGLADGTAVTLTAAGTVSWSASLPNGRLYYSLTLTDKTAPTTAFAVRIRYNTTIIFDGSYVFNQSPDTALETQAVQFDSDGTPAIFSVEWLGGAGQLTINSINFVTAVGATANYGLSVKLDDIGSRPVQLTGISDRIDTVLFDLVVPTELTHPTLTIEWNGGGNMVLFIYEYDIKAFALVEPVSDPANFSAYKGSLVRSAVNSVTAAYARYIKANPTAEFRVYDALYGYTWTATSYATWLSMIMTGGESRLTDAFQIAGPSDIGRPALIPEGLQSAGGSTVLANYDSTLGVPVLRALQPWMLPFGARIAGPDFWPLDHPGCAWYGPLETIGVDADFDVSISYVPSSSAQIVNVTTIQQLPGTPDIPGNRAYTTTNSGAAGGTVSQTVAFTVWMENLRVGAVYTLTIGIVTALLGQHQEDGVLTTYDVDFTATSVVQNEMPADISAANGYQVWLVSVALA